MDSEYMLTPRVSAGEAVAIVGAGAILPDAPDSAAFWGNVRDGRYSIREVPPDRWNAADYWDPDPGAPDRTYCKIGSFVTGFEFDYRRFRIPPRSIEAMDPVQLWAMAAAGEALESAGYLDRDFDRSRTAVIIGNSMAGEKQYATSFRVLAPEAVAALRASPDFASLPPDLRDRIAVSLREGIGSRTPRITEDSMPGELSNVIAGRIAQAYDLGGTSCTVDAACASSLAAIGAAMNALRRGEADMVVSGGVDRSMGPPTFVKFSKIGALSAQGSYPFDARASGFVMGEGCVMLVLKRLSDALRDGDRVTAVVLGVGSSSDGRGKAIAAPNRDGQIRALRRAYEATGVSPGDVGMVEAHGTSTRVGDPVEVDALCELHAPLGTRAGSIPIGSVKSQIGHLKSAAGAAAVLKAALSLHHGVIPPSVNFESPNPAIDFGRSPFRVPTATEEWAGGSRPRLASVSAFGFGGTNFHVVMQEAPERMSTTGLAVRATGVAVKAAEGRTGSVAGDLLGRVFFAAHDGWEPLMASLGGGEAPMRLGSIEEVAETCGRPARIAIVAADEAEAARKTSKLLESMALGFDPGKASLLARQGIHVGTGGPMKIGFMFPGQGSQSVGMLSALRDRYREFREVFEEADAVMRPIIGRGLSEIVYGDASDAAAKARLEERLRQTDVTQPAMLAVDAAMCRILESAGILPDMAVGHSLGEYAALVAAGVMGLGSAIEVVAARGREMTAVSLADPGRMLAVLADSDTVERIIAEIDGYLVPANKNSPSQTVVAGESAAVEKLLAALEAEEIRAVPLNVSHAFHSRIVAPASEPLRRVLARQEFGRARIPVYTNVTGEAYPGDAVGETFVDVLSRQIASPVEFVACLKNMYADGARLFVEVGPRRVLASFAEDVVGAMPERTRVVCSNNHRLPDLDGLTAMWAAAAVAGSVGGKPASGGRAAGNGGSGADDGRGGRTIGTGPTGPVGTDVVVSGTALGLPGRSRDLFADGNVDLLLEGRSFLEPVPQEVREVFPTLGMSSIHKDASGESSEAPLDDASGAIKLAGQVGRLNLAADYGIDAGLVGTMDSTTRMAVAAGLEALADAGIPLVRRTRRTSTGVDLPDGWALPEPLRDETGVIFASAFPGYDRFAGELEAYHEHRIAGRPYAFDRKVLFGILAMGHTQLAQAILARGPNVHVNAACASTAIALSTACDWIRAGRCRRVLVVSADDASSPRMLPWIGGGFLANGAAATGADVGEEAVPFGEGRHGLLVGAGAAAIVVEAAEEVVKRGASPLARIVHTRMSNSAYHGSRIDAGHVRSEMSIFVGEIEDRLGVSRADLAAETIFLSHETHTPAKGGSAESEVSALREAFGDHARSVTIANTKGFTGHPMAVGFEDAIAPWILHSGTVPPIANLSRIDPAFSDMRFSRGGRHDARWVLRFAAGFGSQIAMILYERCSRGGERIVDRCLNDAWVAEMAGGAGASLGRTGRILHILAAPAPDRMAAPASAEAASGPPERIAALLSAQAPASAPVSAPVSPVPLPEPGDLLDEVLAMVSARTGYPADMLDPDMDMEADLGIDTVKQAELFAEIRKAWSIPRQENLRLKDYPTIRSVARFVQKFRATPTAVETPRVESLAQVPQPITEPAGAEIAAPAARPPAIVDVFRARMMVPEPRWMPAAGLMGRTGRTVDPTGGTVVLSGRGPVREAFERFLGDRGVPVEEGAAAGDGSGPVAGVVMFDDGAGWDDADDGTLDRRCAAVVDDSVSRFALVKGLLLAGRLDRSMGFVIGVTAMGGTAGYGDVPARNPSGGALAGLVKALSLELQPMLVKVVDVDPDDPPAVNARLIADELEFDALSIEVCLAGGQRWAIGLGEMAIPRPDAVPRLPERPVLMVTGGLGGIMVEVSERLASRLSARIVIVDMIGPDRADRILSAIERIERAGGTALYVKADLLDARSVDAAVSAALARFGRVDAVLHGAGLEESRGIERKTAETFRKVISVKVLGAGNMVRAVMRRTRPASFLFFSSIAGRFGNAGQTDYAAGNCFMTRLASHLSSIHPDVRFTAVDWTAWDGPGMAAVGSVRALLDDAGIEPLDRSEGAEIACRVIAGGDPLPPEVVVARSLGVLGERMASCGDRAARLSLARLREGGTTEARGGSIARTMRVDPAVDRWLEDHSVDGTPIYPAVKGLESFATTAEAIFAGYRVASIESARFHRALKFFGMKSRELGIVLEPRPGREGGLTVRCALRAERSGIADGGTTLHFEATLLLEPGDPGAKRPVPGTVTMTRGDGLFASRAPASGTVQEEGQSTIYTAMFHGPSFRLLDGFSWDPGREEAGIGSVSRAAGIAAPGLHGIVEAAMQTAGMWLLRSRGIAALPSAIGAVHALCAPETGERLTAVSVHRGSTDLGTVGVHHGFDVIVRGEISGTVAWLEGLRLVETGPRPEAAGATAVRAASAASCGVRS